MNHGPNQALHLTGGHDGFLKFTLTRPAAAGEQGRSATGGCTGGGGVTTYRPDRSVLAEATYAGGILHGPYRDFWSNGRVSLEGQYRDGQQYGEWRSYDQGTGEVREVLRFVGGREVGNAFLGRSGPEG